MRIVSKFQFDRDFFLRRQSKRRCW